MDNVDYTSFSTQSKKGISYKLKRILKTGAIISLIGPMVLTGCGKKKNVSADPVPTYTSCYFDEDDRSYSVLYINEDMPTSALEELEEFGENVQSIIISRNFYIDELSMIADYCPNLESIVIDTCPSITDLSFLCDCPNLKHVLITENGFVTPELVDYFNQHGIEHNITQDALNDVDELDAIIDEIITDDMSDEEKIQAVTYYVINNYKYRITKVFESNDAPLSSTLENKGGVCASYAYLTNVLLRKAGITSYEVTTNASVALGHAWNLVELDGKYYYLDATNIKQIPLISNLVLKHFNIGFSYMTDPRATSLTPMKDFDNVKKIVIPDELIEDIERGESTKSLMEKYGNSVPARFIEMLVVLLGVTLGTVLTVKGIGAVHETVSYHKYLKEVEKRKMREAKSRNRSTSHRNPHSYSHG